MKKFIIVALAAFTFTAFANEPQVAEKTEVQQTEAVTQSQDVQATTDNTEASASHACFVRDCNNKVKYMNQYCYQHRSPSCDMCADDHNGHPVMQHVCGHDLL